MSSWRCVRARPWRIFGNLGEEGWTLFIRKTENSNTSSRVTSRDVSYLTLAMMNTMHKGAYARVTAPMVGQSDLAWRILCRRYGATLTCKLLDHIVLLILRILIDTQMFIAEKLLQDEEYQRLHLLDLKTGWTAPLGRPVVVQLAGNDPDTIFAAAKVIEPFCDAVSMQATDLARQAGARSNQKTGRPQSRLSPRPRQSRTLRRLSHSRKARLAAHRGDRYVE
jgi:hypothetical protein